MRSLIKAVLLILSCVAITVPATAQTDPPAMKTARPDQAVRQQLMYRGSKIIGAEVRDRQDRKIGEIKDLMLDGARGEVAYAVVSFGGVGRGQKYHAIPWQALQPREDGRHYVLHADRETISQAPGFDKGDWPDTADRTWSAEVDRYWTRMVGRGPPDNRLTPDASGAGGTQ